MRIVFVGTVEFSRRVLERLLLLKAQIVGVCTLKESKFNTDHVDLSPISEAHGIPWLYADDINGSDALNWIRDKHPDVIFCFGWSKLLRGDLIALAPLGVVGFHPAALPANRGRHPLIWALILGLEETAATFFFMDVGADSGSIISQRKVIIHSEDDASTLYEKVTLTALEQIEEFVPRLSAGTLGCIKQDDNLANTWRKRGNADGKIDWRMSASTIHNLVRGLAKPYIGAHFVVGEREIKVWKTAVIYGIQKNLEPGKILAPIGSAPLIKCGEDAICLLKVEPSFDPIVGDYL